MKRIFVYSPTKFITQMVELAVKGPQVEIFTYNLWDEAIAQLPQLAPHRALLDMEGQESRISEVVAAINGIEKVLWVGANAPLELSGILKISKPLRPLEVKDLLLK